MLPAFDANRSQPLNCRARLSGGAACGRRGSGWPRGRLRIHMIVDCHTHIWQSPDQLGRLDMGTARPWRTTRRDEPKPTAKTGWRGVPAADTDHHWAESRTVDRSIVLGFKSRYLQAEIPNQYVADYVGRFPHKLIGFAGIDPTERGAVEEVRLAKNELQLRGLTISPANQDFHPSDSRAMDVYAEAERLG